MMTWRRSSSPSMAVKPLRELIRLSASSAEMFGCFARLCILSLLCALILQNKLRLRCRKRHGQYAAVSIGPLKKTCARLEIMTRCTVRHLGTSLHTKTTWDFRDNPHAPTSETPHSAPTCNITDPRQSKTDGMMIAE